MNQIWLTIQEALPGEGGGGSVGNWCGLRAKFTQSVGEGEEWKRFLTNRESRG